MANVSSYKEDFTMSMPVFEKELTGLLVVDPYNDLSLRVAQYHGEVS